ncbi:hypothetical protein [Acaryochloris sp. IP29b_bin.148]|uniref:hypothetical protein n=1 Tax=Acaryochloris sp. IP29b_bin.148 TaxID=2969218 RepID=UPI0026084011|nr:hypothetical protein [Acaryochloris sp. IP29b_bin.148]
MQASIQKAFRIPTIRWKRLLLSLIIWSISEVGLTWLGLDDLADCVEYVFKHRQIAVEIAPVAQEITTNTLVTPSLYPRQQAIFIELKTNFV